MCIRIFLRCPVKFLTSVPNHCHQAIFQVDHSTAPPLTTGSHQARKAAFPSEIDGRGFQRRLPSTASPEDSVNCFTSVIHAATTTQAQRANPVRNEHVFSMASRWHVTH